MKTNLSSHLVSWAWRRLTTTSDMIFFSCWLCSSTDPCSWSVSIYTGGYTLQSISKDTLKLWCMVKATGAKLPTFQFSTYIPLQILHSVLSCCPTITVLVTEYSDFRYSQCILDYFSRLLSLQ